MAAVAFSTEESLSVTEPVVLPDDIISAELTNRPSVPRGAAHCLRPPPATAAAAADDDDGAFSTLPPASFVAIRH